MTKTKPPAVEEVKDKAELPGLPPLGSKTYKGQRSVQVATAETVAANMKLQAAYEDVHAVPLSTYFALRGIKDPVFQGAMMTYTKVRRATLTAFDQIFATF